MSRWITNLESVEVLQQQLEAAEHVALSSPDDKEARAMVAVATYRLRDVQNTLRKIAQDEPLFTIGAPLETPYRTASEIAADGIVGIYKPGAGSEERAVTV